MPHISKDASDRWLALAAEYEASDLSMHKFATEKGISPHSLMYWIKKSRAISPCRTDFARLKVLPAIADEGIIVHLANGVRLEVRGETSRLLLAKLLGVQL